MKKKYSLNYDVVYAKDRCNEVTNIINELDSDPNETDLEQMADYILFGKDQTLLSAVDTKEIIQPKRRYNSFLTKAEQNESLDGMLEDPIVAQDVETNAKPVGPENKSPYKVIRQEIHRTKYNEDGTIEQYGDDFDNFGNPIPFMRELWVSIDKWAERYDMYRDLIPPNEWVVAHPRTKYQIYKLGHFLIDLRRQQYYIKDTYNPTLHFFNLSPSKRQPPNLSQNTGLWLPPSEWCARKRNPRPYDLAQPIYEEAQENDRGDLYWKLTENAINYEDPAHILAIEDNYVNLIKHSYSNPNSETRYLCWDFERLIENTDLTDLELFLLRCRVAKRNLFLIQKVLVEEKIILSDTQLRNLIRSTIPRKLANTAKRLRLESEVAQGHIGSQRCSKCHRILPLDTFFFSRARDKKNGYCSQCKDCQKEKRSDGNNRKKTKMC